MQTTWNHQKTSLVLWDPQGWYHNQGLRDFQNDNEEGVSCFIRRMSHREYPPSRPTKCKFLADVSHNIAFLPDLMGWADIFSERQSHVMNLYARILHDLRRGEEN